MGLPGPTLIFQDRSKFWPRKAWTLFQAYSVQRRAPFSAPAGREHDKPRRRRAPPARATARRRPARCSPQAARSHSFLLACLCGYNTL